MTKEMQLLIKLKSVSKQLASSTGTRDSIHASIEEYLKWFHSEENALNRGMSKEESEKSWKDMLQAFEKSMTGLQYGEEETRDARTWFASGWLAAKMDGRRPAPVEETQGPWPFPKSTDK